MMVAVFQKSRNSNEPAAAMVEAVQVCRMHMSTVMGWVPGARAGGDCVLQHKCEWIEALEVSWGEGVDLEHVKQQWAAAVPSMDGRWIN